MTEYVEPVVIQDESPFADLGLESSDIQPPSDFPVGTHAGILVRADLVVSKSDEKKRNIRWTCRLVAPGQKEHGMEKDKYNPCNPTDSEMVKGFLKGQMLDLGVAEADIPTTSLKSLVGMPVYFTVVADKKNEGFTRLTRIKKNTDGEHVANVTVSSPQPQTSGAVDASTLDY